VNADLRAIGELIQRKGVLPTVQISAAAIVKTPKPGRGRRLATKLTDDQVREIRRRWCTVEKVADIARDFGISISYASKIGASLRFPKVVDVPPAQ